MPHNAIHPARFAFDMTPPLFRESGIQRSLWLELTAVGVAWKPAAVMASGRSAFVWTCGMSYRTRLVCDPQGQRNCSSWKVLLLVVHFMNYPTTETTPALADRR
jgi:hypothetical protein